MTLLEEPESVPMTSRPVAASARVRVVDIAYETDLLHLLSRLDFLRRGAEKAKAAGQWRETMSLARLVVKRIGEVALKHVPANLDSEELRAAHANRREFEEEFNTLARKLPPRSRWHRWGIGREAIALSLEDRTQMKACFAKLGEFVKNAFSVFINRYPSSSSARGWVEAAAIFLVDFNRMVRDWEG